MGTATATVQTNTCGCVPIKPYLLRLQFEFHITLTGRNSIRWGFEKHLEIEEENLKKKKKQTMLSSWVTIAKLWARSLRGTFPGVLSCISQTTCTKVTGTAAKVGVHSLYLMCTESDTQRQTWEESSPEL